MRASRPSIFTSKSQILSVHRRNLTISSPFQNRQVNSFYQASPFQIITYKLAHELDKQMVLNRCNLAIEYTPQYELISQTRQEITIKIKQYPLQLLQWLTKKDALFKANIVLGIYLAFLQLIDMYGLFLLHPNMMKVNQNDQVAIWINKEFVKLQPDQVLPKNTFSMSQFTKTFLRIFKCCLPNRQALKNLNEPKQLINELTKIKRKEEMHKNCHEFIKHHSKLKKSKISNKSHFNRTTKTLNSIPLAQSQSINILCNSNFNPSENQRRFNGFSPLKKQQEKIVTSLQKLNREIKSQNKCNLPSKNILLKKNFSSIETQNNPEIKSRETKNLSLCTTGVLFKRYLLQENLLYNTSKYKKGNKSTIQNKEMNQKNYSDESKQIFLSQVDRFTQNEFDQNAIFERSNTHDVSPYLQRANDELFQPIKFRKMSSCQNEKTDKNSSKKLQMKSKGGKKTFLETDNLNFSFQKNDYNFINEIQQKLKNSFPYKTSSTLNSLRQSNQDQYQYQIFLNNQQQNFNACSLKSIVAEGQKQNYRQIEDIKTVEINELENDFNNIFSMSNSGVYDQQKEKKMKEIITQFQDLFF